MQAGHLFVQNGEIVASKTSDPIGAAKPATSRGRSAALTQLGAIIPTSIRKGQKP
jgi:hypothetical protein